MSEPIITLALAETHDGLVDFYDVCLAREACEPAMAYTQYAVAEGWTLVDLISNAAAFDPSSAGSWGAYCRVALADVLDVAVRKLFTAVAIADDPRLAAHWEIYLEDATVSEAAMLHARWNDPECLYPEILSAIESGEITLPERMGD